jgi:hypothetical protein
MVRARRLERQTKRYPPSVYPAWLNYHWLDDIDEEPDRDPEFVFIRDRWTLPPHRNSHWTREGIASALIQMEALAALCRRHGVALTVAVYPWLPQILYRDLDSLQVRVWREFAAAHGANFIDLFPAFINDQPFDAIRARYFIDGDLHWNDDGHRLVAERVLASMGRASAAASLR